MQTYALGTRPYLAWQELAKHYAITDTIGDAVDRFLSKPGVYGPAPPSCVLVSPQDAEGLGESITIADTARGPVTVAVKVVPFLDKGVIYVGHLAHDT